MAISFFLAVLAGGLSFFSPCILPLVPVYLAVLGGGASGEEARGPAAFRRAGFFVLGFSLVFVLLGMGASSIGQLLRSRRIGLSRLGGLIVVVLGLHQTGLLRIPFLDRQKRPSLPQGGTAAKAITIGMVFALGWTPCVGPVLAGILAMAGSFGSALRGAFLLMGFALGLGIPFLAASMGYSGFMRRVKTSEHVFHWVEIAGGIMLILLGAALLLGQLDQVLRF